MTLSLWQYTPTQGRYIVLLVDDVVQQAAGPLSPAQLQQAQADEWSIPWMPGLAAWIEARRGEFEQVWPQEPQA